MKLPQRLARRQEEQAARDYGGRLVAQSGSGDLKGDVETPDELIECKHTEKLGFRLVLADWLAHVQHALLAGKRPVWEIEYTLPNGSIPRYAVVVDKNDYLAMRDDNKNLAEVYARWSEGGMP